MPVATKTQLTGGVFQDASGVVLALGYLTLKLSSDEVVTGVGQISAGITVKILLDSAGSVAASPAQYVWANANMLPVNSYYQVTGWTAAGQKAFGPNNQQVGTGATFDVGTWTPNTVISWSPTLQSLSLEVNTVPNANQALLNLVDSATVTFTDDGSGSVHATAAAGGVELQTNGVVNADQTTLNLREGTGTEIDDDGSGTVTIAAILPTGLLFSLPNFVAPPSAWIESPAGLFNISVMSNPANTAIVLPTGADPAYDLVDCIGQGFPTACGFGGSVANIFLYNVKRAVHNVFTFATSGTDYWIGLSTDTVFSPQPTDWLVAAPAYGFVGFRYIDGVDTSWQAVAQVDASNQTLASTGVAVDTTGTKAVFEIRTVQGTPGTIIYFINGLQVATISTDVPTTATALSPIVLTGSPAGPIESTIGSNLFSLELFQ